MAAEPVSKPPTAPCELCQHVAIEALWADQGELLLCCTCRLLATMSADGIVAEVIDLAAA
jgi:hypothetical protein